MATLVDEPVPLTPQLLSDAELERIGVIRLDLRDLLDELPLGEWAASFKEVSPLAAFHDDGEFPHSQNIMHEETFPFDQIFKACLPALRRFVPQPEESLFLSDSYSIFYSETQSDTSVNKHTDTSFITVNFCLEGEHTGNELEFFGKQPLLSEPDGGEGEPATPSVGPSPKEPDHQERRYLAESRTGFALIFFGCHPHQVRRLTSGHRVQAVVQYKRRGKHTDGREDNQWMNFEEEEA